MASPWAGAEEAWTSATTKPGASEGASVDKLIVLLNASAKISNYAVTVSRISADNYEVNGDPKQVEAFTAQWQKLLAANSAGIAAMKKVLSAADFAKYSPKVFINWGEPVIDIELVVILFNPVWTDYDQRNSATVNVWWEMFQEDTQQAGYWEEHTVFLDLVPILDPGRDDGKPDGTAAYNLVNDAAKGAVCTAYDMARLNTYLAQFKATRPGKKFQIMVASGYPKNDPKSDQRNKRKAVDALKEALAPILPSIDYYQYPCHPSAFTHGENAKEPHKPNPKYRPLYKSLNEEFAKNTNGWIASEKLQAASERRTKRTAPVKPKSKL